ncbi:MAG: 6-phosphogluconolactonase [Actinoplanes sp.]|jgi:6-phosphogluconolactonase (cycloisomerase 2 family)|nr:6-phosphogluconolactonase [Actinoplanes sp.]
MDLSRRHLLQLSGATVAGWVLLDGASASASPRQQRLYLGSYTSSGGRGVAAGTIESATGAVHLDGWNHAVADPSWLAASSDGARLYAVSELVPDGTVSALHPTRSGPPTVSHAEPTGWGPTHAQVHPTGRFLFVAHYGTGGLAVHPIDADGRLGPATDTHEHPHGSHVHQVVTDPSGRWLLVADLGLDAIFVYAFDERDGRLRAHGQTPLRAGAGPRHLAFHPSGGYVYVAAELNSTVTVLRWADGGLTPVQVVGTLLRPTATRNYPGEILSSTDGRFVYVTNRGDDSVVVYAVSHGGSRLALVARAPSGGQWPRHAAIDRTGRWLFVANQRSDELTMFALDPEQGLLSGPIGRLPAPAVACVLVV